MNFNLNKDAKEKTKYLKYFKKQYDDYEHNVINTSQMIKHFVKLKESDIIKNKKNKAKNVFKFINVFFMIKILLHLINERATSLQIINYFDIKAKKQRYVMIYKITFETFDN